MRVAGSEREVPTFRQIQIVEAIAQHRSIGQAAYSLHVSQPAVTRALKHVEHILGVRLFDRTPNGVMPTIYLQPILKRAQSIRTAMRETERELENARDPDMKRLHIGAGIHSAEIWCNPALASLVLDNPALKISIASYDWNDLLDYLLSGAIEYGIGELSEISQRDDIAVEPLSELKLHFVCRREHPLALLPQPDCDDIRRYPMVGNKMARRLAIRFRHGVGRLGEFDPETGGIYSAIRVTTLNAIKHVLLQSDAVALMPFDSVRAEVAAGSLIALPRDAMPWLVGQIGFISARSRQMTPLMTAFRKSVLAIEERRLRTV